MALVKIGIKAIHINYFHNMNFYCKLVLAQFVLWGFQYSKLFLKIRKDFTHA